MASCAFGAPDNDDFANSIVLAGTDVTFQAYHVDATNEPGEPNHAVEPQRSYHSIWWSWTAPADGLVDLITGNSFATVYRGDSLTTLTLVARWQEGIRRVPLFKVEAGQTYQIAVSNPATSEPPSAYPSVQPIRLRFYPPPPNDDFARRIRLEGTRLILQGNAAGATRESGEPPHGDQPLNTSVWWEWTPPVPGIVVVRDRSGYPGRLWIYRGLQVNNLTAVPLPEPYASFSVTAGETLQLAMVAYASELAGPFETSVTLSTLRIASPEPGSRLPAAGPLTLKLENVSPDITRLVTFANGQNWDHYTNATELVIPQIGPGKQRLKVVGVTADGAEFHSPETSVIVQAGSDAWSQAPEVPAGLTVLGGDFATATIEAGEPPPKFGELPVSGSVWWRWTAPEAGRVMIGQGTLPTGTLGANVEFFTGTSVGALTPVPIVGDWGWQNMFTAIYPEVGRTYWLRLLRLTEPPYDWASTMFAFQPRATNDDYAQPIALTGAAVDLELPHDYTAFEAGEPGPTGIETGSRWFSFTAPENGVLRLHFESWWSVADRTSLTVFTGDSLATLSSVAGPGLSADVVVSRGITYHLRLQMPNDLPETISLRLKLSYGAYPANDHVADAAVIPVADGSLVGSNDFATTEPGQAPHVSGEGSVWYRFTAPEAGALVVEAQPTEESVGRHYLQLGFVTGDTAQSLSWVERQVREGNRSVVELSAGETVLLSVWNQLLASGPTGFVLEHQFVTRPPNDDFINRTPLAGGQVTTRGTNWFAGKETGEPSLGENGSRRTVWWSWTAPTSGILEVMAPWSQVGLFTGNAVTSLQRVSAADTTNNLLGGLRWPVTEGTNYHLAVDRSDFLGRLNPFDTNGLSGFELSLRLGSVSFATPTNLSTFTAGQPLELKLNPVSPALDGAVKSATYRLATNAAGSIQSVALGTATTPPFNLTVTSLSPGRHQLQAVVTNLAGEAIRSPVVTVRVAPANDHFDAAQELTGRKFTNTVVWSGATYQPGEPAGINSTHATVWYRWQAPATGSLRVVAGAAATFGLFTGTNLSSLKAVAQTGGTGFNYAVVTGTNYYIRISSAGSVDAVGTLLSSTLRFELTTTTLSSPADNAVFAAGQNIPLRLDTTEPAGVLASVGFDVGTNRVATLTTPPWEFILTNPPSGSYTVTARPLTGAGETITVAPRSFVVAPGNDRFTNQVTLAGDSGIQPSSTRGASPDLGGSTDGDIWFEWTAPEDGLFFARPGALPGFSWVELYTGTTLASLEQQTNRLGSGSRFSTGEWLVRSNVTYRLAVFQSRGWTGAEFNLQWDFQPPTPNDHFANRLSLSGDSGEELANFILATIEPGERDYGPDYPTAASVWWTWTPPRDGLVEISFPDGNAPATAVKLYAGSALPSLVPIPALGNLPWFNPSPRYYRVSGGVPLQLVYVGSHDNVRDRRWNWRLLSRPANDNFAQRRVLQNVPGANEGTTLGATPEAGETGRIIDNPVSVWWTWTAPADGDFGMSVQSVQTHHFTILIGDSLETLRQPDSFLSLVLKQGETIHIQIVPAEGVGAPYELLTDFRTRPPNDDFAQRQWLEGMRVPITGANWRSTREFGEPIHADRFGSRSVWYAWRAPQDGEVVIHSAGPHYQPFLILAAYEGDSFTGLQEVAGVEIGDRNAPLRFNARAGHDYAIVVDGASAFTDSFSLELQLQATTALPSLRIETLADGSHRLTAPEIAPGVWDLEESFDLDAWFKVGNIPTGPGFDWWVPAEPERSPLFFRLRRLD